MNIDISKNELYISELDGVLKDYIPPCHIPFCRPRRSDAFVYILGGSCKYLFSDNHNFTVSDGDVLYLAKDAVYEMDVLERYDFICVNFFFGEKKPKQSDRFRPKDSAIVENLFYRLWKKQTSGAPLAEKMSLLYSVFSDLISSRHTPYLQNGSRAKIEEAMAIVSSSFGESITVESLARHAGMSEVYFRKLFKTLTGVSPAKFMIDQRIKRSKELLSLDYLTLEDVSERCGFSSLSYFCRVFKENVGMTPGEFRKTQLS